MSFLLHPCKKYQGFRPFTAFFSHTIGVQGGGSAGSFLQKVREVKAFCKFFLCSH